MLRQLDNIYGHVYLGPTMMLSQAGGTLVAERSARVGRATDDYACTLRGEVQCTRILAAALEACSESGIQSVTVSQIVARARVSRKAFYDLFEDRGDCLLRVFDEAVATVGASVIPAYRDQARWVDGIRCGLSTLLGIFDANPGLARLCIVDSLAGDRSMLVRRVEVLKSLAEVIDEGRAAGRSSPPLTSEGVVGGACAVIHSHLLSRSRMRLLDLVGPLMAMIVMPYLGNSAARRELDRRISAPSVPPQSHSTAQALLGLPAVRLTDRTVGLIMAIGRLPGASNRQLADAVGVVDNGQISKLLSRLARLGFVENSEMGSLSGRPNKWTLTPKGRQLLGSVPVDGGP